MSADEVFVGLGLTVLLAVACQIAAARFRIPAIVLLLPVGFFAGQWVDGLDPTLTLGDAFGPLVSLGVALILFDGGLDLVLRDLEGHSQRVVRRLLVLGVVVTVGVVTVVAAPLLDLSGKAALMLATILVVSGPTVVAPLLEAARPGRRVSLVLAWEGTTIDPVGAVIGALVFQGLSNDVSIGAGDATTAFLTSVAFGLAAGAVGAGALWLALGPMRLRGVLATEAIVAVVVGTAALADAVRDDTGLIAALTMGIALANVPGLDLPEDRRFFRTVVQLVIGLLFISIAATVTVDEVTDVLGPTLVLIAVLVLAVRPLIAVLATVRTSLTVRERAFVGWMHPRGIVAASTAATFGAPLAAAGIAGADDLLPVTFLVIVGTVTIYGLTAVPLARMLGLAPATVEAGPGEAVPGGAIGPGDEAGLADEPDGPPPAGDV